jgi:hypothetical protein
MMKNKKTKNMNNKFVKAPTTRLSKEAAFLLFNLNNQTHPDLTYRDWVNDAGRDSSKATQELIDDGYLQEINGVYSPSRLGVEYFRQKSNTDINDIIRTIKQILPKNLPFGVIVENLTDTALIGLLYAILGEIGIRGNPEDQDANQYWQNKINALNVVLKDATPDTLWEHHKTKMEAGFEPATKKAKAKTK